MLFVLGVAEQIVGRERDQRVSYRQLVRNVVARRRVNSTVGLRIVSEPGAVATES